MAVHTHITEGINLPRSASPNVSITAPPGTTPALLVAASQKLIREKSESGREGKTRERRDRAQHFKTSSLLPLQWEVDVITGPARQDSILNLEY